MNENESDLGAFLAGFVIGALVGAATALILAPQSGQATRSQVAGGGPTNSPAKPSAMRGAGRPPGRWGGHGSLRPSELGKSGCGLAFAPAARPPTAQARYADARPRLRSPLNVVSVRTTALPARSRTRRPAPVRLGSFRFRPSARSPSLASGCLALGNARKLADLGRRCLQKRSGSEIRAD